jgi:hypothetical protein
MRFEENSDTDDFLMVLTMTWPFWSLGLGLLGYLVYLSDF